MKKLALSLDELAVDSFATDAAAADEGTVLGQEATRGPSCDIRTRCCPETYDPSCADTCTC